MPAGLRRRPDDLRSCPRELWPEVERPRAVRLCRPALRWISAPAGAGRKRLGSGNAAGHSRDRRRAELQHRAGLLLGSDARANDERTIEVEFQPQTRGAKSAELIIPGAEGELEVPLTGEGATGTLTPSSSPLRFSPLPYARPEDEGEGNETEELNVLDSLAGSEITSVSIAGPDASSFSLNYGNCEHNTMASGNACDEGVRFEPRTTGTKHAVLLIESDASSGALEIPLEGVALNGAQLSIDSSQALLGEVALGGSAQHVFTLSNTGDYPLFLERAFLVSGTPLMFPKLQDSCSGHVIQPGSSCSMTIAFQPSTVGEKDAGMILITSATPSIQVIGIDGVGVVPAPVSASSTLQPSTPAPVPFAVLATVHPPRLESGATLHTGFLARRPSSTGGRQN